MNALKKLTMIYETPDDVVIPKKYDGIDSVVNEFFGDDSNNGFFAEIVPVEYIFYWTIYKDEYIGENLLGGYAECKCSVRKKSQKFNLSKDSAEEVYIRQRIFLDPLDEETRMEIAESVGAYKNGTVIEGTYKVPSKFINDTDYRLIITYSDLMLLGDKPYYAFIAFSNDIAYLYNLSDGLNENIGDVPDGYKTAMNNFHDFLKINDPDLLSQDK